MNKKHSISLFAMVLLGCVEDTDTPITSQEPPPIAVDSRPPSIEPPSETIEPPSNTDDNLHDKFDNGHAYPAAAKVNLSALDVPAGSTQIHAVVSLDKETPNTVISFIRVLNGSGGRARPDMIKPVIFRPGDPLQKSVTFDVSNMSEGNTVKLTQANVPDGGMRGQGNATVTARAGSVNEPLLLAGRESLEFNPKGNLVYSETGSSIKFDDEGSSDTFSTSLSHGRTQPGNGETGYYAKVEMGGFEVNGEVLTLKSFRTATPFRVGTPVREYPFLASMLSGHHTTSTQFRYGSIEWEAKMPNRRGAWPALWLLSTAGWPPEIDVYEGFGYNGSWRFSKQLSTNLHGGSKNKRAFTRPAFYMTTDMFGISPTLDSEFHKYAVTITPKFITMFIDGKETMQYANPFAGHRWYPLTNVAVKAKPDSDYTDGKGAMELRSLKVWRVE